MAVEERAEGIVLRRRAYSETSLIVALLTREAGVVHLLVRGGARRSRKGNDVIDLLRVVQVSWRSAKNSDLHTARGFEVVDSFEAVAREPEYFELVGWLSRFLLGHAESGGEQPQTYAAMVGLLHRIRAGTAPPPLACWVAVMLTVAREEGVLPHYSEDHDRRFEEIMDAICAPEARFPVYDRKTWESLRKWVAELFGRSGFSVPDGWRRFGFDQG